MQVRSRPEERPVLARSHAATAVYLQLSLESRVQNANVVYVTKPIMIFFQGSSDCSLGAGGFGQG